MKTYKTVNVPASTYRSVDKTICDVCGKEIVKESCYYRTETTVEMEIGEVYPEGGTTEVTSFDLCTDCFSSKLVPFLKSLKAYPTIKEKDY